mgnify:CR=1 FL=1
MTIEHRCEIAVVGSGPGGAVAACLLAEAGRDVLLIEEGSDLSQESCGAFSINELLQKYRHGGATTLLGPSKIAYVEGCVVGGGSEVNSGLYHRTPPAVLADWKQRFRLESASEADLAPYFDRLERDLSVGYWPGPAPAVARKLSLGASQVGLVSREAQRMFAYGQVRKEAAVPWERQSMSKTYIPRALAAGTALLPRTRIASLGRINGRWVLKGRQADRAAIEVQAQTVFLACGAVQTPALLRRSGLSRCAGQTLALHPMIKVAAEFDEPVNDNTGVIAAEQVKLPNGGSLGCSASSPSNLALTLLDHDPGTASRWRRLGAYYVMAPGGGQGAVRLIPGFSDPLPCYRLSNSERRCLAAGLGTLCEALFAVGARAVFPSISGLGALLSLNDLSRLDVSLDDSRLRLTTVHLLASCPIGETRESVADSFGGVHGHDGLYLCDASSLCGPVGVNPQGTIMAFAARNTMRFLGKA